MPPTQVPGIGAPASDQLEPFQVSVTPAPTATQEELEVQLTADGPAPVPPGAAGVDMIDQAAPFHCSNSDEAVEGVPAPSEEPTATQNEAVGHDTPCK